MIAESRHELPSSGGFTIAAWRAVPERDPVGSVVLCHGLTTGADDDGPFLPLRDRLLRRGLAVIRFDARCHGETGGGWRDLSLSGWRDDILAAMALADGLSQGPPLMLAASFSGGPAIAAILASPQGCAGVVFWNPVLDYPRTFLSDEFAAGAEVVETESNAALPQWAQYELPWVSVPLATALVDEMRADGTPQLAAGLSCPGIVIHGRGDPFVDVRISRDVVAEVPQLRLVELPLARHGFRGLRPLVRALSAKWLAGHAAA